MAYTVFYLCVTYKYFKRRRIPVILGTGAARRQKYPDRAIFEYFRDWSKAAVGGEHVGNGEFNKIGSM